MKLYNNFKRTIDKLGPLKMAWFTTFNFNVSFFEKYILTALTGNDPKDFKTASDYETLNRYLLPDDEENPIDVKVFYDFRAADYKYGKKTCIKTKAVNPALINSKHKGGVFHPKVGLLVNQNNEGYIITGSANISLGGWGRNSESISIKKIEDKKNAKEIISFFLALNQEDKAALELLNEINNTWQETLGNKSNWTFVNSLTGPSFLNQLLLSNHENLYIWSPYFSDDLSEIINKELTDFKKIHIIPDLEEGSQIRMKSSTSDEVKRSGKVNIYISKTVLKTKENPMVHAKVWLTENSIAIGSWNFTKAGMNIGKPQNVEAGIFEEISKNNFQKIIKSSKLDKLNIKSLKDEDIDSERELIVNDYTMSLNLIADWNRRVLLIDDIRVLGDKEYFIKVAGFTSLISTNNFIDATVSFHSSAKALLRDRIFVVYDQKENGNRVFVGLINEINFEARPILRFDTINDYFKAWVNKAPEREKDRASSNYSDTTPDDGTYNFLNKHSDLSTSWFNMFLSLKQISIKLDEKRGSKKELSILGYSIPGSINELYEHVNELQKAYFEKKTEISWAYLWFLVNEANTVIKQFNMLVEDFDIKTISLLEVKKIEKEENMSSTESKKWLKYIKKECLYEK